MKAIITGFKQIANCPDETEIEFVLTNDDSVNVTSSMSLSFAGYLYENCTGLHQPLIDLCECFLEAVPLTGVTADLTELLSREFVEAE